MEDDAKYVKAKWLPANQLKSAVLDVFLALLAVIVVGLSLFMQSIDPLNNWFMRSGAIMVLIGAVMEYRHNVFQHAIDMTSIRWASGVGGPVIFEPSGLRSVLGYIAHVLVVIGTFVGAYGDLILGLFQRLYLYLI